MNFWKKLNKPILALAPMADVTDPAFRFIIAKYSKYEGSDVGQYGNKNTNKYQKFTPHPHLEVKLPSGGLGIPTGGPDVMWTEFISADGLALAPEEGRKKLLKDLEFTEIERPIVAQFFTSKPKMMEKAGRLAYELGFDGVDINMGCPDKSIEKQGSGAALIKNPALARELISAAKSGAKGLPVSVKTRIGYGKNEMEEWIPELIKENPAAIIVHARTRKEMSKTPARWESIKTAVRIRNELKSETLILGNGDVLSIEDAYSKIKDSGCDGAMLGRAIFGNPFLFRNKNVLSKIEGPYIPTVKEKLSVLVEHTTLFEKILGDIKNFSVMKKHYKAYVSGFERAVGLRAKLMETNSAGEVKKIVEEYLQTVDNY